MDYGISNCALTDGKFRKRLVEIIAEHKITTVVETGIDQGGSTILFSQMVRWVIGIDNNQDAIKKVGQSLIHFIINNVTLIQGNSPDVLKEIVKTLNEDSILYLLDAHWQAYWPLRDEIKTIPRGKGILVMHDAKVPGHPSLGYDTYGGQALSYEYLRDVLWDWSPTHRVEYNDDTAEFPRRGVMYVYPR